MPSAGQPAATSCLQRPAAPAWASMGLAC